MVTSAFFCLPFDSIKLMSYTWLRYDEGTILTLGTFNITTDAEVDDWLATIWFPQSTEEERQQILVDYPQDPTQGVSRSCTHHIKPRKFSS